LAILYIYFKPEIIMVINMSAQRMQKEPKSATEKKMPRKPAQIADLTALREKHKTSGQGALSAEESLTMILSGNKIHQSKLIEAGTSPESRYNKIMANEADYVVITCSDARVQTLDSETDGDKLIGVQIRVAGNVIPEEGVSLEEIKEAISRVKKGGLVIIEGHCSCGAVGECVKWINGGKPDTGSKPLNSLLRAIEGTTPEENATGQHNRLKELVGPERKTAAVVYDWNSGKVSVLASENAELTDLLKSKWEHVHQEANSEGDLGQRLSETQKPHAIVVLSNDMPFSADTVCDTAQNELFATTGSENGLDDFDAASALYAVEHLHPSLIAFIAPQKPGMEKMFEKWEQDLRAMPEVAEKLDSGKVTISRLGYDLKDGSLVRL
jgi:carbonic anhydrase